MQNKKMTNLLLLISFFLILPYISFGQGIKYRISVNTSKFYTETRSKNIIQDPSYPMNGSDKFQSNYTTGFEIEVSVPLNNQFAIGLEYEKITLQGFNDDPIYFNYFSSPVSPVPAYNQEPILFDTKLDNFKGNIRYYFWEPTTFTPFFKFALGVSFAGTDLRFKSQTDRETIKDPIYSRGTKLSSDSKWPAFIFDPGIGFEFQITDKILFYTDASVILVDTDIIDGMPTFSYFEDKGISEHIGSSTIIFQIRAGLCYSSGKGLKFFSKEKQTKFRNKKGRFDEYLPFYENKNR